MFVRLGTIFSMILVFGLLTLDAGCSAPATCVNGISSTTVDPSDNLCKENCDCNNQHFVGFCSNGKCNSLPREPCLTINLSQECVPKVAATGSTCKKGVKICKDLGLNVPKWGDCKCPSTTEAPKPEKPGPEPAKELAAEPTREKGQPDASAPEKSEESYVPDIPLPEKSNGCEGKKDICSGPLNRRTCKNGKWVEEPCSPGTVCSGGKCDLFDSKKSQTAYYKLDELNTQEPQDYSGKGRHGEIIGTVTKGETGKMGKAFQFEGKGSIRLPTTFLSQGFTFCAWLRPALPGKDNKGGRILSIFGELPKGAKQRNHFYIAYNSTTGFLSGKYTIQDKTGWEINTSSSLKAEEWSLVCFTADSAKKKAYLFINGISAGNSSMNIFNFLSMGIIQEVMLVDKYHGRIDEVRFWDKTLTAVEIESVQREYP